MYAVCSCEQAAESGLFYQQISTAFVSNSVYYRLRERVARFCSTHRSVKKKDAWRSGSAQTHATVFSPPRRVRLCLVGTGWWWVSPPAEMKWSTRHYKHSAPARQGSGRCQRLRDGITVEKKVSGKEEKLLSLPVTTLSRPGSGELGKLKPNWKKDPRAESRDPTMWRRGVLQQGSYGSYGSGKKYGTF